MVNRQDVNSLLVNDPVDDPWKERFVLDED
jgi:hypothetical protein